jgi:hypothetical protein
MTIDIETYLCKISRSSQPIKDSILKLGGSPVFMKAVEWPKCQHCGQDMSFLAQIPLQHPIVFSKKYTMAYVFMCPGKFDDTGSLECETWDPFKGSNTVILQENTGRSIASEITSEYPDYVIELHRKDEPLIDTDDEDSPADAIAKVAEATKIGGVPLWLQSNERPTCPTCGEPMRFVAQLAAELDGFLPADHTKWDDERYKFFHFGGDDGTGYLFLCKNECGAAFLWQCG